METKRGQVNIEEPSLSAAGVMKWVLTTKVPLLDAAGSVTGIVGMGRDITERKRTEEKNLQLAALVESSDDAIVGLDQNRIVKSWNRGAERVYGYSAEEIIGRSVSILNAPGLEDEARSTRAKMRHGEYVEHMETRRKRKDGTLIDVSLTLSPILNPERTIVGYAGIARDITEQKKVQAQLLRVQKLESLSTLF